MFTEYSDTTTCAINTLTNLNAFSLSTCFDDGNGASYKYACSNGAVTETLYTDTVCQTLDTQAPNPVTYPTTCQGGSKVMCTAGK